MRRESKYQTEKVVYWIALGLFCVFAFLYFLKSSYLKELLGNPTSPLLIYIIRYRIVIPTLILTISSCFLHPRKMTFAFLFCFIGDYLGAADNLTGQLAGFAIAQVIFSITFYKVFKESEYKKGITSGFFSKAPKIVMACLVCLIVFSFIKFVPGAELISEKIGVAVYVVVISSMILTSFVAGEETGNRVIILAGLSFLLSDFLLALHIFLFPHVGMKLVIIIPYYGALLLFWLGTLSWKERQLC